MTRLLVNLCDRINLQAASLLAEAEERREQEQELMRRVDSIT
jgi:hypothetical protein